MLTGACLDDVRFSAAAAFLALVLIGIFASPALRHAVAGIALCAALALMFGGAVLLVELVPALIAGLVGWVFARTLLPGRRPLIARAIAAVDGDTWLTQQSVARYARRLTGLWVCVQALLTLAGCASALHAHGIWPALPLPTPRAFAGLVLPGAVAFIFLAEFFLRPMLLPQAPRHGLVAFLGKLARSWPRLVE